MPHPNPCSSEFNGDRKEKKLFYWNEEIHLQNFSHFCGDFFFSIEGGYFEYSNFEFENGNFENQSGELKWGTKVGELKSKLELKANLT